MKLLRLLLVIWIIATIHFTLMLTLGVMAFLTQGDFDQPAPPVVRSPGDLRHHRGPGISRSCGRCDASLPERHEDFTTAAIATSLLWGLVIWAGWAVWPRSAQARA